MAYFFKHGDRPLDDYTIQRAVGSGGFGEVYYALSDGGREVALKYLRSNPQIELRGVSHCINLKSPHLVSIFDVKKSADEEYFIVMEYCSGPSLRDLLIAEPDGFPPEKAAFFLREIAKGLSYLHDRGIVHRDLKPGNIFYDDGYVKIGDYGLSKFISVSRHSAQTASVGTVHYMAPEIGSGNYSRGIDIYALGVMLYEMLLGRVPFEGSSMGEVLMKHLTLQPEVDDLPDPFAKVIRKALAKNPADRYQTVEEMMEDVLAVDQVKESLAGFSPQSLAGAVRQGMGQAIHSPMPSPNPMPAHVRDFAEQAAANHADSPTVALPPKLAKRMDRISRKIDQRVAKLGGKPIPSRRAPVSSGGATMPPSRPAIRKRAVLSGLVSMALAAGLALLIGDEFNEEAGASAFLMVGAMALGLSFSPRAIAWFSAEGGPSWAQRVVRGGCLVPLLFVGAVPMLSSRYDDEGLAMILALLIVGVFATWEKTSEKGARGELSIGAAIWKAVGGLLAGALTMAIFKTHNDDLVMFGTAGVAGVATLVLQTMAWWRRLGFPASAQVATATGQLPAPPVAPPQASPVAHPGATFTAPMSAPLGVPVGQPGAMAPGAYVPAQHDPLRRWGLSRVLWGILSLVFLNGVLVTVFAGVQSARLRGMDWPTCILGVFGFAAASVFALRKTSARRRPGIWLETLRPLLWCVTLVVLGSSIALMARPQGVTATVYASRDGGMSVFHEEKVYARPVPRALPLVGVVGVGVSGSMMLVLLGVGMFGRPREPKPFVQGVDAGASVGQPPVDLDAETPPADITPLQRPSDDAVA